MVHSRMLLSHYLLFKFGGHLLSHTVTSAVPSASQVLTIVFGMGTGVTPGRIATKRFCYPLVRICRPNYLNSTSFHFDRFSRPMRLQNQTCSYKCKHLTILSAFSSAQILVDN